MGQPSAGQQAGERDTSITAHCHRSSLGAANFASGRQRTRHAVEDMECCAPDVPRLLVCQAFSRHLSEVQLCAPTLCPGCSPTRGPKNVTLDDVRRAPTGERRGTLSVDLGSPNDDTRAELAACFGPSFLPQQNSSDTKSKDNSELRSEGGNSKQAGCPLLAGAHRMRAGHRPISRPGSSAARLASLLRGRASRLEEARRSRRVVYRQEEEG